MSALAGVNVARRLAIESRLGEPAPGARISCFSPFVARWGGGGRKTRAGLSPPVGTQCHQASSVPLPRTGGSQRQRDSTGLGTPSRGPTAREPAVFRNQPRGLRTPDLINPRTAWSYTCRFSRNAESASRLALGRRCWAVQVRACTVWLQRAFRTGLCGQFSRLPLTCRTAFDWHRSLAGPRRLGDAQLQPLETRLIKVSSVITCSSRPPFEAAGCPAALGKQLNGVFRRLFCGLHAQRNHAATRGGSQACGQARDLLEQCRLVASTVCHAQEQVHGFAEHW